MTTAELISGPYTHQQTNVSRTMGLVMLALLPATLLGFHQFGLPALFLFLITLGSCVVAEAISVRLLGKPIPLNIFDGSAILTGWLLALSLPPWAPWWIGVLGGVIAIVLGKQVFGGLGQNLFNPAMVARVALLISFPLEMTTWVAPHPLFSADTPGLTKSLAIIFGGGEQLDAISSATVLGHVKTELGRAIPLDSAMGDHFSASGFSIGTVAGSMGETSAILLLLGGLFLIYKRIITWHIPVATLGSIALLALVFNLIDPSRYPGAVYHLLTGASLLGAFFIATDLVTSPVTPKGQLIFGAGVGVLTWVIRTWAGYPEGLSFAILLMNALTPLIDHYTRPRIFGRTAKGAPLQYKNEGGSQS